MNNRKLMAAVIGVLVVTNFENAIGQETITISITRGGANAKYVREGASSQEPVPLKVGDTVKWVHNDPGELHSASSRLKDADGKFLFDTGYMEEGGAMAVTFDRALYSALGGTPGGTTTVEYFCRVHPQTMGSSLVISDGDMPPGDKPPLPEGDKPPVPDGDKPVHPPAQSAGGTFVIEAGKSDGPDLVFNPNQIWSVRAGSEVEFRLTSGIHQVRFTNWEEDREHLEIVDKGVSFDMQTGASGVSDKPGTLLVKVRIKSVPADRSPIDFFCPIHGAAMAGKVQFRDESRIDPAARAPKFKTPLGLLASFDAVRIGVRPSDSYYAIAADMNNDQWPDLVVSGLGRPGTDGTPAEFSEVAWYENPGDYSASQTGRSWKKHVIGFLDVPVAMAAADVDQDGLTDLAICYEYGLCIIDCKPHNGTVAWLENPGATETDQDWTVHHIGKHLASHRLSFGHFTQPKRLELLSVPVVGGVEGAIHDPIELKIFTQPDDVFNVLHWQEHTINDVDENPFRVIHDIETNKFGGSKLDQMLLASEEGVTLVNFAKGKWQIHPIGAGETKQVHASPEHWQGSGTAALGSHGKDSLAYIAASEPFHGNMIAVYTKDTRNSLTSVQWRRRVVDVLGELNNRGEGPGHDVVTADFDGDGNDEFLVGMRGPMPYSGVQIFKPVDLTAGKFLRQQVSSVSAAVIVVADFDVDGRPDFATIPYRVLTYFEADDTEIMLFLNRTPPIGPRRSTAESATRY